MALFLLSGFPVLMAAAVFLLRQDRVRKIILFLTSFVHLFVTIGFWQGPRDVQFNPFLGFDAVGQRLAKRGDHGRTGAGQHTQPLSATALAPAGHA